MVGENVPGSRKISTEYSRVEKYRPDTLDDVSGHQDILATINKFVESNVPQSSPNLLKRHD